MKTTVLPHVADRTAVASRAQPRWARSGGKCDGQYDSIECLAGCYDSHADAQQVAHRIEGLSPRAPARPLVLGPVDAPWLRFMRRSRSWSRLPNAAGESWGADPVLLSMLGAMACALVVAGWVLIDDRQYLVRDAVLALSLAAGAGAVAGAAFGLWRRARPSRRQFDRVLRRHLQAGRWVLVVHDGVAVRQPDVVEAVRVSSRHWCSVSSARAPL